MVKAPTDLIADLTSYINQDTSDVAIALLEDLTDTLNNLSSDVDTSELDRVKAENEDLRKRYIARFNGEAYKEVEDEEEKEEKEESTDYEDLFE